MNKLIEQPRELLEAIGELALAIAPHNHDRSQRQRIAEAMSVLIDHVLTIAATQESEA